MKDRFYMICTRDTVGTNAAFHCKNGQGYATDIRKAHVYTREDAQKAWGRGREIDQPVCADSVDALAMTHVDHQYIPCATTIEKGCDKYVAFVKDGWDGNDVYWIRHAARPTTDFTQAFIFSAPGDDPELVFIPFHLADAVKRPTFPIALLNHRKMVTAAGLVMPDHIRRWRRNAKRGNTGKVRWNCPGCGKIHWQLNPYDFESCRDATCEHFRWGMNY